MQLVLNLFCRQTCCLFSRHGFSGLLMFVFGLEPKVDVKISGFIADIG